jgi:hypothetical protein
MQYGTILKPLTFIIQNAECFFQTQITSIWSSHVRNRIFYWVLTTVSYILFLNFNKLRMGNKDIYILAST